MAGSRDAPVHAPGTSWIDLASAADRDAAFDHARAFVHYADQAAALIWQRMRDACVALATEMGGRGIGPHDPHEIGSTWHNSGTLFIGDDPGASVTDTSGRFHHIANAACVDQALFPTVGSANPVLTGLCLARKAAETIVARHVSAPAPDAGEIAAEKAEGFTFLLEPAEAGKWVPNDARLTASAAPLRSRAARSSKCTATRASECSSTMSRRLSRTSSCDCNGRRSKAQAPRSRSRTPGSFCGRHGRVRSSTTPASDSRAIEIQIDDTGYDPGAGRFRSPMHRTGSVYGITPARRRAEKAASKDGTPGFWNDCRIVATGSRISVSLNDRIVSEGELPQHLVQPGMLALQYHSGKVQFRAIRIRRL